MRTSTTIENVRPSPLGAPSPVGRADARLLVQSRPAFTLLEVVIVLIIVAVLATLASLRYAGSLDRYRLDGASRRIIAEVSRAQVEARTTSASQTVRFNISGSTVAVLSADDILNSRAGRVVSLADDPYRAAMAVNGLASNVLTFNAFGDPSGGGIITLTRNGLSAAVAIDASSGRAYVLGTP
ncbi:MAG: prepilin-type N-terminal cleavage/methylation domain-containing protein [Phycisphaerales bacterium]|nr:prepilin-type N-terminal cleavage/methylation domain-containing protein [Phycisphaerales bacterium]